ncbi:MAG: hypothetical protein GY755_08515 [Chloroflexi bacterium]|nr:hypothetical protein [Chloroflexota bacterium]
MNAVDIITGQTWRQKLEEMGMSIADAQACFEKAAFIQNRQKSNSPDHDNARPWESHFSKSYSGNNTKSENKLTP